MPMNRKLYPKQWNKIARAKKNLCNWRCEWCDRPCRQPNESWHNFCLRLIEEGNPRWYLDTHDMIYSIQDGIEVSIEKPGRFVLTIAHLDQNPTNNKVHNLAALCTTCHNRHDAPYRAINRKRNQHQKRGQLELFPLD